MFNAPEGSSFFYQNGSLTLYNTGIISKQVFNQKLTTYTGGAKHSDPRAWPLGCKIYQIDLKPDPHYDPDWIEVDKIKMVSVASGSR